MSHIPKIEWRLVGTAHQHTSSCPLLVREALYQIGAWLACLCWSPIDASMLWIYVAPRWDPSQLSLETAVLRDLQQLWWFLVVFGLAIYVEYAELKSWLAEHMKGAGGGST